MNDNCPTVKTEDYFHCTDSKAKVNGLLIDWGGIIIPTRIHLHWQEYSRWRRIKEFLKLLWCGEAEFPI